MRTFNYTEGKYHINVFAMSDEDCPFVYSVMEVNDARNLVQSLADQKFVLVAISGLSWEDDLSPWPAEKVFRTGKAFGGKADRHIRILEERVLPKVEESLSVKPIYRVSAGYSLAGLCSLYALYRTTVFRRVVCASGSLWYDGFLDFMQKNPMKVLPEKVYFSLGSKEKQTKNPKMALVEIRTKAATVLLEQAGVETIFEENPGGHFYEPIERLARGIRWVLKNRVRDI